MRLLATALVFSLAMLLAPQSADARVETEFRYPFAQLWAATIRLLRVDHGFPIHDRDATTGFILFNYEERGRESPGSVELVRGEAGVRITIQVPSLPSYVSRMLLDRLTRKLRADFGDQPSLRRQIIRDTDDEGDDEDEEDGESESDAEAPSDSR